MKNTPTIQNLRQNNWKVAVIHKTTDVEKKYTRIIITTPDKTKHAEGFAYVHKQDTFNRKIGNRIALGRALKNLENDVLIESFPPFCS